MLLELKFNFDKTIRKESKVLYNETIPWPIGK